MHVIAAKAVAFGEALQPEFRSYIGSVKENAQVLALVENGFDIVSSGTDTHLMLVDLRPKGINGKVTEAALGRALLRVTKMAYRTILKNLPSHPAFVWAHRLRQHAALGLRNSVKLAN